jgi:hypothetical protein
VRIHLARKHARELELRERRLEGPKVLLDGGERPGVAFFLGKLDERRGVREAARQTVERVDRLLEARALAAEFLRLLGLRPDRGVLELAPDLVQALFLLVVLKGTSSERPPALRSPSSCASVE